MAGTKFGGVTGGALLLAVLMLAGLSTSVSATEPREVLEVRFSGSTILRGEETNLRAGSEEALDEVDTLLDEIEADGLDPLVHGLTQSEAAGIAAEAREVSGTVSPNMANWYRLTVPFDTAGDALRTLRSSRLVDYAARAPEPVPPPVTPDYTEQQLHLNPAPTGIGSELSTTDPRIRGAGVTVVDLEYYWTASHEDLQLPPSTDIGEGEYIQYTAFGDEHGTAVFGILVADDNGFGVTGAVPEADMKGISPTMSEGFGYNPAGALTFLASRLNAGDVVLIEQQADGPAEGSSDYVPMEWNQANFDAIRQLSNLGIIVVETGGNGGYDLDSPEMLGRFDRFSVRDSDAIMVGAGDSVTRSPLWFSSHGERVDLQGYGNNIVTTGGSSNFFQGGGFGQQDIRYTSSFGGTSGAGPIVTSAVVSVLSYLKATGQPPMTADQIVSLLRLTGTPQPESDTTEIGPLPNIEAAVAVLEGTQPSATIDSPVNGAKLDFDSAASAGFSCDGGGSPIVSCLAVDQGPDGDLTIASGDRLPTDQPGLHTLTATVTNQLGLTASSTVNYQVGPGCLASGMVLASAEPRGNRVRLLGAAEPSRAGQRVKVLRNGKQVGSALISEDGTVQATVRSPRSGKAKRKALYRLALGRIRSSSLKARGGVRIISQTPRTSTDLIKARLAGVRKRGSFTLRTRPLCGGVATIRQVRHGRRGDFTVELGFGPAARTYTILKGAKKIQLPLVLPAARFVLGG